jgi:hypothetical protein
MSDIDQLKKARYMWVISNPTTYLTTFVAGMVVGFFLGVHAVQASSGWSVAALALVPFVVAARWRDNRDISPKSRTFPAPPLPGPSSVAVEAAQSALISIGYSVREAQAAVASTPVSLDAGAGADAAAIVWAVLRARRS